MSDSSEAKLRELLKKYNIEAPLEFNTPKPTRGGPTWLIAKKFELKGREVIACTFGDFSRDIKESFFSEKDFKGDEKKIIDAKTSEMIEAEKEEALKIQVEVAPQLEEEFGKFEANGKPTPYLERKRITSLYGTRVKENPNGSPILIVPMRDIDGKFWNYQRIYSEKLSAGDKFFAGGARIDGCFHELRNSVDGPPLGAHGHAPGREIYIAEGFATAASVKASFPENIVLAAFNAGNLLHVATAVRERYPDAAIIICADNDAYTVIKDKPYNVGLEKGRRAAGSVKGEIRWPIFKYPKKGLTDFNDLALAEGLDKVRDQIEHPENYIKGVQPMCLPATRSGAPRVPGEKEVAEYLLKEMRGKIVKQDRTVFIYSGTHWEELSSSGLDLLKQWIQIAANGLLDSRDLRDYLNYLLIYVPLAPRTVNLHQPNPLCANFQNGTLHLFRNKDSFKLEFHKHNTEDYLTSVLPFEYPEGDTLPPAPEFEKMIQALWSGNADQKEIERFAYQLVGGVLMPAFPIIAFFWGRPNSGKSTFIKLLIKMVGYHNTSNVQPCDWHGFNMAPMVGKLINYDTDIDVNKPMNDSELKKIIDRTPRSVRRKNQEDARAFLPAVHLFAANAPPKTLDGSSHAYGRRIGLIHTDSFQPGERPMMDPEQSVLETELKGIVARGLVGLRQLAEQRGQYSIPESSKVAVKAMEMQSDVVGQFLEDVLAGEVMDRNTKVQLHPDLRMERPKLWEVFSDWQNRNLIKNQTIGKHEFLKRIELKGFQILTVKGFPRVSGIGLGIPKVDGVKTPDPIG